jgi:NADPH:quinone reductase-like Zn-dependent oxidoreductase
VQALGADHVIDYKVEDFTQTGQQYDLILAVNGYHPLSDYLRALKPEGTYVVAGGSMFQLAQAASNRKKVPKTGSQKICVASLVQSQKDLILIKDLVESGKIMPIIDGCYPLSKTSEAFWYFEKVHPKGKVVISVV